MSHLANLIAVIKRGVKTRELTVSYQKGPKFLINFVKVFYDEGFIQKYVIVTTSVLDIKLFLKPGVIKNIKIISAPGRKVYTSVYKLKTWSIFNPNSIFILSTSQHGIISSTVALVKGIGGEVLCRVDHV